MRALSALLWALLPFLVFALLIHAYFMMLLAGVPRLGHMGWVVFYAVAAVVVALAAREN